MTQPVPPRAVQLVNGPTKPDLLRRRGGALFQKLVCGKRYCDPRSEEVFVPN